MLGKALSSLIWRRRDPAPVPAARREAVRNGRGLASISSMRSWVLLCGSRVDIDAHGLLRALDEVFPGQFLPSRDGGGFVVGGPSPDPLLIQSKVPRASGMFMLLTGQHSYVNKSSLAGIADPALRKMASAQPCWFSIDLVQDHGDGSDAYAFIGPALAHLAPHDAAVLLHPTKPVLVPFVPLIRQRLAAGLAPEEMAHPP